MHYGKKVSETLSKALQHLIAAKNIDIYIVPPDVTVELSFINTNDQSTLSLYKAAVADESQAGLYAPQHTKTGFGITTGICVLILLAIIVASVVTEKSRRDKKYTVLSKYSI